MRTEAEQAAGEETITMTEQTPRRVRRMRMKGWKMPPNTVYVGRGSKWGNPFTFANSGKVHPAMRFACEVAPLLDCLAIARKEFGVLVRACFGVSRGYTA